MHDFFFFFYFYSKDIIQRVKREFLLQNLGYYLKKKYEEWIFRAEYIFAWNGLVFEARQNKGVLVPNWIPVVHEKHNFNLSVKKKKKCRHKTNGTKNTKCQKKKPCLLYILKVKLHNHPLRFESFANWPTGVFILQYNHLRFLNWWNWLL